MTGKKHELFRVQIPQRKRVPMKSQIILLWTSTGEKKPDIQVSSGKAYQRIVMRGLKKGGSPRRVRNSRWDWEKEKVSPRRSRKVGPCLSAEAVTTNMWERVGKKKDSGEEEETRPEKEKIITFRKIQQILR